jgi:hypothetical protein
MGPHQFVSYSISRFYVLVRVHREAFAFDALAFEALAFEALAFVALAFEALAFETLAKCTWSN